MASVPLSGAKVTVNNAAALTSAGGASATLASAAIVASAAYASGNLQDLANHVAVLTSKYNLLAADHNKVVTDAGVLRTSLNAALAGLRRKGLFGGS